jgi:hypothetical protein
MQAFAHPQARFLYEKMWQVSPRSRSVGGRLLGRINYVSYAGIHSAMAMGVVRQTALLAAVASAYNMQYAARNDHGLPQEPHPQSVQAECCCRATC